MSDESSLIQRELKQRKPFRTKTQEAILGIRRTADLVYRTMAEAMEPFGVTDQQYNVLRILRGAHPKSLNTLEIGERMIERQPGVTRLLDRLEAKGLVRRQRCVDDRRVVHCWISDAGLELLEQMEEPVDGAGERLMGSLTLEEQRQLVALLDRVRAGQSG